MFSTPINKTNSNLLMFCILYFNLLYFFLYVVCCVEVVSAWLGVVSQKTKKLFSPTLDQIKWSWTRATTVLSSVCQIVGVFDRDADVERWNSKFERTVELRLRSVVLQQMAVLNSANGGRQIESSGALMWCIALDLPFCFSRILTSNQRYLEAVRCLYCAVRVHHLI